MSFNTIGSLFGDDTNYAKRLDRLGSSLSREKKPKLTTPHQVQGVYYAKKLGCKKPAQFGVVIKFYKTDPQAVSRAWSFVSDYPNSRDLFRLFCWKYWQIKKEASLSASSSPQ
jgi:hypothetical protein